MIFVIFVMPSRLSRLSTVSMLYYSTKKLFFVTARGVALPFQFSAEMLAKGGEYRNKTISKQRKEKNSMESKKVCVICGNEFEGFGNNPARIRDAQRRKQNAER